MEDACKTNYKPVFSPVTYWTYKTDPYLGCYSEYFFGDFSSIDFEIFIKFIDTEYIYES